MQSGSRGARAVRSAVVVLTTALAAAACERVSYWSSASPLEGGSEGAGEVGVGVGPGASGGGGDGPIGTASLTVTQGTGGVTLIPVSRRDVLRAVATCAVDLYATFQGRAATLATATQTASTTQTPSDRDAARVAWREAIDAWQQAELIRVGAAGPATLPGGRSLRDEIYSWPLTSRCLVEQTLVSRSYLDGDFADASLVNVRGLAAAEYLLHHEGADNGCNASSSINTSGSWSALGAGEIARRKAEYAAVVAAAVKGRADAVAAGWSEGGGEFAVDLRTAGQSGSPFDSAQVAIDAVADGLFYLDTEVKDLKVGKPIGRFECDTDTCLDAVESPFARRSARHVENNLIGFQRVFDGCEASGEIGFDDLLATEGAADLAARMQEDMRLAIEAAAAIEEDDLAAAILADRPSVDALHAAIKRLTDELKTDVVTVLNLSPPESVEGDND